MAAGWDDHMATFHTPHSSAPAGQVQSSVFIHSAAVCRANGRGVAPVPLAVVTRLLAAASHHFFPTGREEAPNSISACRRLRAREVLSLLCSCAGESRERAYKG